jgi:hypothetical protein
VNGVVRRRYFGNDDLAHLIASLDEDDRLVRTVQAEAWRAGKTAALEQEAPLTQFDADLDALTAQILTVAGYHRHNYGKWRKKRGTSSETIPRTDSDEIRADRTG